MKLFTLSRGRSKKRLAPIMIDSKKKCENYRKALKSSDVKSFHYDLVPAPADSKVWRKSTSGKWSGYNVGGPKVVARKAGKGDKFGA